MVQGEHGSGWVCAKQPGGTNGDPGHGCDACGDREGPEDLKLAAEKQEIYLRAQLGTILGTVVHFQIKKEARQ